MFWEVGVKLELNIAYIKIAIGVRAAWLNKHALTSKLLQDEATLDDESFGLPGMHSSLTPLKQLPATASCFRTSVPLIRSEEPITVLPHHTSEVGRRSCT